MILGMTSYQKEILRFNRKCADARWRAWFAWYPVKLDDGRTAWLSMVTTCKMIDCSVWQYLPLTPIIHS